ncbi:MAG TPA: hemerythrin domain-containing protein [Acidimicrobiales bacterium]|nr:hemerythrin domain-containing protein [Acidimicrobiales bacterium]
MTADPMPPADTSEMPAVHKVFRDSLASAPQLIASASDDDARREMIANYYANLISFLRVHHDGEEELVFPVLIERAPEHRGVLDKAAAEHKAVLSLMAGVDDHVEIWQVKGDEGAKGVVDAVARLEETLIPHLDDEEVEVLPLAAAHMNAAEWGQLPGHAMSHFQGDKVWLIIGLIRENFTQQQRDMMLEHMPPPARQMWENMGERSFNELIAEVRRTS